ALGETRVASSITIASVAISVVVALLILPIFGMVGAAITHALALVLVTCLTIIAVSKKIRLDLDIEAMMKSLIAGILMASILTVMQMVMYSRFLLPLYVLVGIVAYLVMLRL